MSTSSSPPASPPPPSAPAPRSDRRRPTRRELLALLGSGAAGLTGLKLLGALDAAGVGRGPGLVGAARVAALDARAITAAATAGRALVVVELSGGNDGLSTLVPFGDPAYRQLREATAVAADEVLHVDDTFGFHPQLAPCAKRLAALHGVGVAQPTGSHFEMSARWWAGDVDGTHGHATGFLGRLCDALDDGAPVTGVSLAGTTPAMLSARAVTIGLPALDRLAWLREDDAWSRNLRRGFAALATAPAGGPAGPAGAAAVAARAGLTRALAFGPLLDGVAGPADGAPAPSGAVEYPSSELGGQLRLAASLLGVRAGIRVVHASIGGFDTHTGQRGAHDERMREIGDALAAFAADLDRRDLAGSVLVATTSEFGRRARDNGSGTDHGTASCALLMGPVHAGLHGEPPSLTALDDDDNLRATASIEEYYATFAETWFGVDAAPLLASRPRPIAGIIAT